MYEKTVSSPSPLSGRPDGRFLPPAPSDAGHRQRHVPHAVRDAPGRVLHRSVYGLRRGFSLLLPLAALLLFLPTIFLFYNSSAWVYAPACALIALAGNGAGKLLHGKR